MEPGGFTHWSHVAAQIVTAVSATDDAAEQAALTKLFGIVFNAAVEAAS